MANRFVLPAFMLLVLFLRLPVVAEPVGQATRDETALVAGNPVMRSMRGGETHAYRIALAANQFLDLVVLQQGVDVVVRLVGPDGKQLAEVDGVNGGEGPEPLKFITRTAGDYLVVVTTLDATVPPGRYRVTLNPPRPAIPRDSIHIEAEALARRADLFRVEGKRADAVTAAEKSLALYEQAFGPEHLETASALNKLAYLHHSRGEYAKAEPLFERVLAIREKISGSDDPLVALSLNDLGMVLIAKGDYAKPEPLLQRALAIREKAADSAGLAQALNNLAHLYQQRGEYARAEPLLDRSLVLREKALGPEDPLVAYSLIGLASLHQTRGEYGKAEPLFARALAIREKKLGPDHPDVAAGLSYLALLLQVRGDYGRAEPLFARSLAISEKVWGPEHMDVANSLNNLAEVNRLMGRPDKAEPLFRRSLAIKEKLLGPNHPYLAFTLAGLAGVYMARKEFAAAEPFYRRALAIREKALGADHPFVAQQLNDLGFLAFRMSDWEKAETLYRRALDIRERGLGPEHPYLAGSLENLAVVSLAQGRVKQAVACRLRGNEIGERDLQRNLAVGSERQKLAYLEATRGNTDRTIDMQIGAAPNDPDALKAAITIVWRRKGRALDAMTDGLDTLRRRATPEDKALLDEVVRARGALSNLILKGPGKAGSERFRAEVKELEERIDRLEATVAARSAEFRAQTRPVTFEAVRASIPSDGIVLEYAAYRPYDLKTDAFGKRRYVVYAVGPDTLAWADLGDADRIDAAVAGFRRAIAVERGAAGERRVRALGRELFKLIVEPVAAAAAPARHWLVSPDGDLNLVPFAALVDETESYLVEKHLVSFLTSGRDLLRLRVAVAPHDPPLVLADPAYADGTGPVLFGRRLRPLPRLRGTHEEGVNIKRILSDARLVMAAAATEQALKAADRPVVLHVATHGAFLADQPELPGGERLLVHDPPPHGDKDTNPLLRSCLFFAGANQRTARPADDGTLTALEAAGLDLWGTRLVVLSACDTGVGEVHTGDGVYGLRRAFFLAGSEAQMMSLWPVADKGTRDLMVGFYTRLAAGDGRAEALREAQLAMLKSSRRRHPFYWAGFIESGDWTAVPEFLRSDAAIRH